MQTKDEHFFEDDDRSRLLEAIEQQAKSLSMARGSEQHRLSDWLNAAEEVMPEVKKPAVKPMSLSNSNESKSNTAQIMGFLLAGTLVLSMAGGGGFAYMQLTQQISLLEKEAKSMGARVGDLEKALQESEQKIALLTTKSSSNDGTTIVTQEENKTSTDNSGKSSMQQLETLLDTRFKQLIDALDNRSQGNKTAMNNAQQSVVTQSASPAVPNINNHAIATPSVSIPAVPQIVEVKLPSSTDSNATGDMHQEWLKSLPSEHLVLQLGSSTKASDLSQQGAKISKNPEMAHVISVKANGSTRYILVYGGFATREEAKQSADDIKNELGITPWVRRAGDVRQLLDKR